MMVGGVRRLGNTGWGGGSRCLLVEEAAEKSLMNFKRDLNLLEKSDKFSKIPSLLDLHKTEFSWNHLYARN
jgi:hypothetical protein